MVHDIITIQQLMSEMENTLQKVQDKEYIVGTSKPYPLNTKEHDSNEDETMIEISSAPTFSLDYKNNDEDQQPLSSDDFIMVLDEAESSGSQHSTSKPKQKKKYKLVVPKK